MQTKPRRVGTLTAGLTLILLGVILLIYTFYPNLAVLEIALRLWPLVLILLGIELLCVRFDKNQPEPSVKIDFASILIMLLCIGFAFFCEFSRLAPLHYWW